MSKIFDNLYLGSYDEARNQVELKKKLITHIVTVGSELKVLFPNSFKYLYIPAYDTTDYDILPALDTVVDFIHKVLQEGESKVFVHCLLGKSRSATCIIAYLIKYHNMTPEKAQRFVKSKRSIILPNEGFVKQLSQYATTVTGLDLPRISKTNTSAKKLQSTIKKEDTENDDLSDIKDTVGKMQASFVMQEENKNDEIKENIKYHCKSCGTEICSEDDIFHNGDFKATCPVIYLSYMSWMGLIKNNLGKLVCPNSKCNGVLGYAKKDGEKCCCGKYIDKIYAIYPNMLSSPLK